MRRFSDKEKEVLKILNGSNGMKFQSLIVSKIIDSKLIIDNKNSEVRVRYRTANFVPTDEEMRLINQRSNDLFERIYLAVTLVNYFETKGLIGLFMSNSIEDRIDIGNSKIDDQGVLNKIEDKTISQLLLNYTGKTIIVTSEFNEFVNNNFIDNEEARQIKSIKLAWTAVIIAFLTSIISLSLSFLNKPEQLIQKFYDNYTKNNLDSDFLHNQLDELKLEISRTNNRLDSIIVLSKEKYRLEQKIINNYKPKENDKSKKSRP